MRHGKKRSLQNRFTSWQNSTLNSLARSLLIYQSIKTTTRKAKAVRPLVEKLIRLAKSNTLSAKRRAFSILKDHSLVSALFKDIGPRFTKTQSGFTRIIPLGKRRGDDAEMSILELTEIKKKEIKKHKKEKEARPEEETGKAAPKEKPIEEKKQEAPGGVAVKEKPPITKKPAKNSSAA